MSLRCPSCDHAIVEDELPRLGDGAKLLCPQCAEPLTLPEMTIPLSLASTARPSPRSGLDPTKKFALLVLAGVELGKVIDIETTTVTIGRSGCEGTARRRRDLPSPRADPYRGRQSDARRSR